MKGLRSLLDERIEKVSRSGQKGERVAVVSHNSARLLTSFFGVSGSGRVLVPINFRLSAEEISYIVEHCGARVLLIDEDLAPSLSTVTCAGTPVLAAYQ